MKSENIILIEEIKTELIELKNKLKHINKFSAEKNTYFTNKNQKLDVRATLNNQKSEEYLKLKNSKPKSLANFELISDILSENIQIHHEKFVMTQEFLEDIYGRLDTLGRTLTSVIDPSIKLIESYAAKSETNNVS